MVVKFVTLIFPEDKLLIKKPKPFPEREIVSAFKFKEPLEAVAVKNEEVPRLAVMFFKFIETPLVPKYNAGVVVPVVCNLIFDKFTEPVLILKEIKSGKLEFVEIVASEVTP